jgi:hypothetical protein
MLCLRTRILTRFKRNKDKWGLVFCFDFLFSNNIERLAFDIF